MPKTTVYNQAGEKIKDLELNPAIFGIKAKPELIQQAVVAQQANRRQVLAHTKNKGEVRGGGKKPWRQKGTGRARHGSIRSPLWRGGGITFGPTNERNFSLKINKKAKRKALLMCLSDKAKNERIILVDNLELAEAKTKKFFQILLNLKLREKKNKLAKKTESAQAKKAKAPKKRKSVLLVLPQKEEKLYRAGRNLESLGIIQADSLNVLAVLGHKYLLMPIDSLAKIEKTFLK
ncbi:MAG: hypothetical protein A3J65_01635 [Candidatus Buchananbacteria bacterium RIFCSPHIGHO2_02_FULL_45_11b]|uniref:Large ribosomal subunit protein uL4 n=3 Tax=Candidatus Buchananiibacteriota TaxID=1817903 RepID=A0A1G1Y3M7_9BACT|nr:MAG: hypothetical protein A2663_01220 [Candidatus Buchananbacteria bacterium RIFCSPHIGHO2_01_FULL_46_12]OGY50501.1 MAG: hypothetical protein A3J65_01635 [Candidatus Buchananbacteria bacterium RIFCSPHIGHO2_02_FULL_45_11b]OGY57075.1 MAG: hypothetical protein A3H67_05075 [Candidatus Buchananbacteria bacterium RIFCSPLOWO2_02_FULL_46_11b]